MNTENKYFQNDWEIGTVVAEEAGWVTVELFSNDACHACGAKMFCQPNAEGRRILRVPNTLAAQVGEQVLIEQIGKKQLALTTVQYGLPLIAFLVTVIGAHYLIKSAIGGIPAEIWQMLLGVIAIGIVGIGIYFWSKRQARRNFSVFRLREVVRN